jgi:hypothetical protein
MLYFLFKSTQTKIKAQDYFETESKNRTENFDNLEVQWENRKKYRKYDTAFKSDAVIKMKSGRSTKGLA